jgi:leucyl-tRNA synthetase
MAYDFKTIEKKWQKQWDENPPRTKPTGSDKKFYCLDMFPYPSGAGLHMGHWRSYVLSDIYARTKWLQGYNVLHPMGWDAFGSPAENAAIKEGVHPATLAAKNIANFKRQLKEVGALYDWDKELNTTDPDYYKWTQWIFLQMYKAGLAYEAEMPINWCPSCLTGIANEEVVNGGCERCGTKVEQKNLRQWVLKITQYAQKLLDGLDKLEWPERVKVMQRNWIGKSEGAEIVFTTLDTLGSEIELPVFTTRPDTIFGVTFLVMAPDHDLVDKIVTADCQEEVEEYRDMVKATASFGQTMDDEKTGVFTGAYARNPANDDQIPIYIADYVLSDYGTGVIMAVPGHDERDFAFAQKFDLPRPQVVFHKESEVNAQGDMKHCYIGDGKLVNSGAFDGLDARTEGATKIVDYLVAMGKATRKTQFKLRDWLFSRQRYWGEPIPLVHCKKCGIVAVPEDQLPVTLPQVEKYQPTGTGESPLATIAEWVNTSCPQCGGPAKRETNTMPQWAGSCWYFLRYPNPHLKDKAWDMKDMNYWLPVDLYVGGIEHAILHLLYSRFYVKVLFDLGLLSFDEPFLHLYNQGMILKFSEKSGLVEKMSKSKGNVVNPDEMVAQYGSDAVRLYIMFMGPPELDCEWQDAGLEGTKRLLNRIWDYLTNPANRVAKGEQEDEAVTRRVHLFVKEFQERMEHFKPNTAIAAFMELTNDLYGKSMVLGDTSLKKIISLLSIFAPHMASELAQQLLGKDLLSCGWPVYNPALVKADTVTLIVQVNGKVRANLEVKRGATQEDVSLEAEEAVLKWLVDKQIVKVIFVPDRLLNFVVHD